MPINKWHSATTMVNEQVLERPWLSVAVKVNVWLPTCALTGVQLTVVHTGDAPVGGRGGFVGAPAGSVTAVNVIVSFGFGSVAQTMKESGTVAVAGIVE